MDKIYARGIWDQEERIKRAIIEDVNKPPFGGRAKGGLVWWTPPEIHSSVYAYIIKLVFLMLTRMIVLLMFNIASSAILLSAVCMSYVSLSRNYPPCDKVFNDWCCM